MPNQKHKQQHDKSCGAACLMVAAYELGIANLPDMPPHFFGEKLEIANSIETKIYTVTCKNKMRIDEYSMPDGIAEAATAMGLEMTAYMSGCFVPKFLSWKYPSVLTNLSRLGVSVEYGTPTLEDNERMLVVVSVGGIGGLHYVLYRPDGTYMDPAYGENYAGTLWGMGQMYLFRYIDTGIYLVVRNGSVV